MSRIHVTIDRLAIGGLGASERRALVEGLKGELVRVLADPAARSELVARRTPVIRLGPVAAAGGRAVGERIARAIGGNPQR